MRGLPLTGAETVALLEGQISELTMRGAPRERAVVEVANRHRVPTAVVAQLVSPDVNATGDDHTTPIAA